MTSYFHCRPPLHPTQAKEVASEPSPRGTNTIYYAVMLSGQIFSLWNILSSSILLPYRTL